MRGNFDDTFFNSINEVFICLVTSAMITFCPSGYTLQQVMSLANTAEFKYNTTVTNRILHSQSHTWHRTNPYALVIARPMKTSSQRNLLTLQKPLGFHAGGSSIAFHEDEELEMAHSDPTILSDEKDTSSDSQTPIPDIQGNEEQQEDGDDLLGISRFSFASPSINYGRRKEIFEWIAGGGSWDQFQNEEALHTDMFDWLVRSDL
ncbi:hypothetical protein L211DRAFT_899155 [Terfezia boudieri ATCC MYA-4762]|uniref:Uncharacterized protein n=1 Tax=Terfezia boudieri ATCC MYA-4762 TaxID=1051890 RepID=A0A3N4LC95_9PEZI|nr:hypothetical protein L211DRAFT_899155 [Terfezia boudieri ATCC MYA-4762]